MAKSKRSKTKKPRSSLVEYGDYDEKEAEQDSEELKQQFSGRFLRKLPEGKTRMRFIPPLPGKRWKVTVMEHFFEVPGVGWVRFVCPKHATKGKRNCKTCARAAKLNRSDSPADEKQARNIRAKRTSYAQVVLRDREEDGTKIFQFGPMIEGELTDLRNGGYNFVNPETGCDVFILKRTTKTRTTYKVFAAQKGAEIPLSENVDQMNDWISDQEDLTQFTRVLSDEDIDRVMQGEKPLADRKKEAGKGKSKSKTLDDDIDDEDEDDEEDEDAEDEDDGVEFTF